MTLHDWLHTLEVAERCLPADAHPAHLERLRAIKEYLKQKKD